MSRTALLWMVWLIGTLVAGGAVAAWMLVGGDRTALLPDQTTGVHHQFEVACETCHTADPFEEPKKVVNALNKTCRGCHDDELAESDDSHPRKKFRDPRMANFWEKIDARLCTSCHIEHKPEITRPGAVTLAMNYCVACHSEGEQDVRANRASHAGLAFDSCASAGCHNFHDNRALYEDFLVKHADQPWLIGEAPVHALSAASWKPIELKEGETSLTLADARAPAEALADLDALQAWAGSGHAAAGVNCGGCHAPDVEAPATLEALTTAWVEAPSLDVCQDCHKAQTKTFRTGRHGMRGHPEIAKPRKAEKQLKGLGFKDADERLPQAILAWLEDAAPPPAMTVAEARIPMKASAQGLSLGCGSCHAPHEVDRRAAAVEACATCHDDSHTREYFESPHHELWLAELSGAAPAGSGVSCAACHMPKSETHGRIETTHNQNTFLRPNEKMIRPVCLDCHGLGFAIDALADPDLVARNFKGRPSTHIESIDWAVRRVKTGEHDANQ